jgi:hypothetical protein
MIASLGGFLARKGDPSASLRVNGEPGVKTIWLGLGRLHDKLNGFYFGSPI